MPKAATSRSAVFEAPGLQVSDSLRPDAIARIELLRIVFTSRPMWDVGQCTKAAAELEKYVAGQAPE